MYLLDSFLVKYSKFSVFSSYTLYYCVIILRSLTFYVMEMVIFELRVKVDVSRGKVDTRETSVPGHNTYKHRDDGPSVIYNQVDLL